MALKLYLVAEQPNDSSSTGHVFLGGISPDGTREAWGFYPQDHTLGAVTEDEPGVVTNDLKLFSGALAGDKNFAYSEWDVSRNTYDSAMTYMKNYASSNNYGLFTNSCVSAGFNATSSVGLTSMVGHMPAVAPQWVYDIYHEMRNPQHH